MLNTNEHSWEDRWNEANRNFDELSELRVVAGHADLAALEGQLLEELDEFEYEDGLNYFRQRGPIVEEE